MKFMKESYAYQKLEDKKVQCLTCSQKCVLAPEGFGVCGVRKNIDGVLYALNYGRVFSYGVDPVEKKPLFHFLPGTVSFSFATVGCNLRCANCQNWKLSQDVKSDARLLEDGEKVSPEEIVEYAIKNGCKSISYTYSEPTIFLEYALDTMKIAHEKGLKNIWVTNGFMSSETLDLILPYLDAANVDIKFFDEGLYEKYCGARLEEILKNTERMKRSDVWVEVTTLVIPNISDNEMPLKRTAEFIREKLGAETPWHLSVFSGEVSWKMQDIPDTSVEAIHKAHDIGMEAGLQYVYAGNIIGDPEENTYCPKCKTMCVRRIGYLVDRFDKDGRCHKCGENLHIVD